jgi:hypothetical protein
MRLRSFALAATAVLVVGSAALAKDRAIGKDVSNPAAEWCRGENAEPVPNETASSVDCHALIDQVALREGQPGLDGANWNCKLPDGSRRCFSIVPNF